jgi:hypothetical protein
MIHMQFPEPVFRTRIERGQPEIFDPIRRQWVALQPEEWVRQNFIQWLIHGVHVPAAAIAVEKRVDRSRVARRFDLLIYDHQTKPWMMVELKSTEVKLDESVLMQVLAYSVSKPVPYIAISNGKECHIASRLPGFYGQWLTAFPAYPAD